METVAVFQHSQAALVDELNLLIDERARRAGSAKPNLLILLFCWLRLEASPANATTPHRRNLRANDLHLITAARRTFRLMTHDLLATFVYVAHFGFTEHFKSVLVHASITFLMPALWMSLRFDTVR